MKKIITLLAVLIPMCAIAQTIGITSFGTGFSNIVEIVNAGDSRLFVVEKTGAIRILNSNGTVNTTNFLTLTPNTIKVGNEQGLLGLAFHPSYATNGFFYVNYTRTGDGATVIARYSVSADVNVADAASALPLLVVAQPFDNHNGGTLKFGPDGFLYIGMGDGGGAGDPGNRAQNINENLGKMLRIDVNSGSPYANPAGNPFIGTAGNDEIWAIGLRNPWKFSFNRLNGDLWIADVGQGEIEEINQLPNPLIAGQNLGWRCYEGNVPFNTSGCAAASTMTMPVAQYTHTATDGCSVTGGYYYTGTQYPNFANKYFFADFCLSKINYVDNSNAITFSPDIAGLNNPTTFGQDLNGELYIASGNGTIYKIVDTSLGTTNFSDVSFSIYPNPASESFKIDVQNMNLPAKLQVYDLSGKLLMTHKIVTSDGYPVTTHKLLSGVYLVKVEDALGNKSNSKLVIE